MRAGRRTGLESPPAGAKTPFRRHSRSSDDGIVCGITGFIDRLGATGREALTATATGMADAIAHRGPDAGGVWVDEAAGVAFGHRRLAVIDLSDAAAQPMISPSPSRASRSAICGSV
jgi:asparagine synthetase B (glutamine-hydrolysing)